MKLLQEAPLSVRGAAIVLTASPWFACIVGFRLYAHPRNPDAWFILAILAPVYAFAAFLVLKRFGFVRWIWAILTALTLARSLVRFADDWRVLSANMLLVLVVGLVAHATIAVLLFLPSASAFFRAPKNA